MKKRKPTNTHKRHTLLKILNKRLVPSINYETVGPNTLAQSRFHMSVKI